MTEKSEQPSADSFALPWIISSDSHIIEPPDLWTRRADEVVTTSFQIYTDWIADSPIPSSRGRAT